MNPITQTDKLANVLARLDKRKDLKRACIDRMLYQLWLIRELPGTEGLDLGCNTGVMTLYLAQLGYVMHGVDLSEKHLAVAERGKKDCSSVADRLWYIHQDATKLPWNYGTFDWAVCTELLEHVPHPKRVLENLWRVVKPGGRIYVSTPRDGLVYDPAHINVFSIADMRHLARDAGFDAEFCCSPDLTNYIHWTAVKRC